MPRLPDRPSPNEVVSDFISRRLCRRCPSMPEQRATPGFKGSQTLAQPCRAHPQPPGLQKFKQILKFALPLRHAAYFPTIFSTGHPTAGTSAKRGPGKGEKKMETDKEPTKTSMPSVRTNPEGFTRFLTEQGKPGLQAKPHRQTSPQTNGNDERNPRKKRRVLHAGSLETSPDCLPRG